MTRQMLHNQKAGWPRPSGRRIEDDWAAVTMAAPCTVCGATTGCAALRDERFVRCARWPSEWPMTVGGWLHRLAPPPVGAQPAIADGAEPSSAGSSAPPTASSSLGEAVSAPDTVLVSGP